MLKRPERPDEHRAAACVRRGNQPVDAKKHYQRASGLRSFSNSLVTVLTPVLATALLAFTDIQTVIAFDLFTFAAAFTALLLL